MSNLFKLEKLVFRNFKLFGDEFVVNFNSNALIVFDGPNGHGKTTIYDAIELALTGDIRRLAIVENLQTPADVVVAHKNRRDCFVEIVLKNSHETLQIKRSLKANKPQGATKISNFKKLWDLSLITNSESKSITQQELNQLISSDNLERDFTLFHYVEQEDTAHFLKMKTEKQRAEALSVLFGDTVQMKEKVAKVKLLEKQIKDIISDKNKEKVLLSLRGNLDSLTLNEKNNQLKYGHLLYWNNQIEWDKEVINDLTKDKRDNFFFELNKIKRLIEHKEYYLYQRKYHIAVQQEKTLNHFLGYSQYVSRYNELKDNFEKAQLITRIINDFNASKLEVIAENTHLPDLLDLVDYKFKSEFYFELNQIVKSKIQNTSSSKFISEVIELRRQLLSHSGHTESNDSCLFCGTKFEETKLLINSIESKGTSLKLLLSKDEQQIHQLQGDFVKNRINVVLDIFKNFLTSLEIPSKEHLGKLRASTTDIPRFEKLRGWLLEEKIKFTDLLLEFNAKHFDLNHIITNTQELQHRIIQKISAISESYEESNANFNFDNVFAFYFESKGTYLERLNIVNVDKKIAFIDNLYIDSLSTDLKMFKKVTADILKLEGKQAAVKRLRENLNITISRYQKLLIKDIEIPFYIYSGKVLQAHQSGIGNGIFIKDKTGGDILKNIRFVSNWDSDHDVLNTMSSGQIAAIVITLYLALNKVYAQGFGCLLIDDPVQTMDEINMISLVELLRNEFSDRQIILSTHEDHVSKYFLYKFLKYHLKVRQIKLIDRKEFQLSNPINRPLVSA